MWPPFERERERERERGACVWESKLNKKNKRGRRGDVAWKKKIK